MPALRSFSRVEERHIAAVRPPARDAQTDCRFDVGMVYVP
jgi:hypothetical protein